MRRGGVSESSAQTVRQLRVAAYALPPVPKLSTLSASLVNSPSSLNDRSVARSSSVVELLYANPAAFEYTRVPLSGRTSASVPSASVTSISETCGGGGVRGRARVGQRWRAAGG